MTEWLKSILDDPSYLLFHRHFPQFRTPTPCNMYFHRQVSSRASQDLLDLQMGKTVFLSLPSIRTIRRQLCWAKVTLSNQRKSTSSNALTGIQYGGVLFSHKEGKSFRHYTTTTLLLHYTTLLTGEPWGRDVRWKKKGRHQWTNTVTFWGGPNHIRRQQDRGFGGLVGGEGAAAAYWAERLLLGGESDWLPIVCLYNQWPHLPHNIQIPYRLKIPKYPPSSLLQKILLMTKMKQNTSTQNCF